MDQAERIMRARGRRSAQQPLTLTVFTALLTTFMLCPVQALNTSLPSTYVRNQQRQRDNEYFSAQGQSAFAQSYSIPRRQFMTERSPLRSTPTRNHDVFEQWEGVNVEMKSKLAQQRKEDMQNEASLVQEDNKRDISSPDPGNDPAAEEATDVKLEEGVPDNGLTPPDWLPPLQCNRQPWNCECARECFCRGENQMTAQQIQAEGGKPIIQGVGEAMEGMPSGGFKCKCEVVKCECMADGVCTEPHKGDHVLDFVGGYLKVPKVDPNPFVFNGASQFTIEAWIKLNEADYDDRPYCIVSRFNYGVSGQFRVWIKGRKIVAQRETKDRRAHRVFSGQIPTKVWVHFAVVYTGRSLALVVNGQLTSLRNSGSAEDDANSLLVIGACQSHGIFARGFRGNIDDVRIWNVARSLTEIRDTMFERLDPMTVGLVGYWMMNLGTGTVVADRCRGHNHAKIGGTIVWRPSNVPVHKRQQEAAKYQIAPEEVECGLPDIQLSPMQNFGLKAATTQSSTCCGGDSKRGVDGVDDANWGGSHCTHTHGGHHQWWRVDLGDSKPVGVVKLRNRADCCWDRMNGVQVYVGDKHPFYLNAKCDSVIGGAGRGALITRNCKPAISGRYVYVANIGQRTCVTLCHVDIRGPPSKGEYIHLQPGGCGDTQIWYKSVYIPNDPGGGKQIRKAILRGKSRKGYGSVCYHDHAGFERCHANHCQCQHGRRDRFGQLFKMKFYEAATSGSRKWTFHVRLDAGWGYGAFLDGRLIHQEDHNLYKEADISVSGVSQGFHYFEIALAEGCCDGNRGGWSFTRDGQPRRPMTEIALLESCVHSNPHKPPDVHFYDDKGCKGSGFASPLGIPVNLCAKGFNDRIRSIKAPAGTMLSVMKDCGHSEIKEVMVFYGADMVCQDLSYGGPSFIKFDRSGCREVGYTECSKKQLFNAFNMGYRNNDWGILADGHEARVTETCDGNCFQETVPYRGARGNNVYCCKKPDFINYIPGPIETKKLEETCLTLGSMWGTCSYGQLKRAEDLGFQMCVWGRFGRLWWNVAICGSCGTYQGEQCVDDTLRTTPRSTDSEGVYCCHVGCA